MSPAVTTPVINDQASKLKKKSHLMQLAAERKEWDGRCSNSFTDNDEAIDMAAGDTTPKLIRHTLYTHNYSRQFFFFRRS